MRDDRDNVDRRIRRDLDFALALAFAVALLVSIALIVYLWTL